MFVVFVSHEFLWYVYLSKGFSVPSLAEACRFSAGTSLVNLLKKCTLYDKSIEYFISNVKSYGTPEGGNIIVPDYKGRV